MQIEPVLLSPAWRVGTTLVALPCFAYAVATAPWRTWLTRTDRQHVWLGSIVLLVLLWSMRAGITPGLSFQFLLAAALTLMHGWRLALVGFGAVLAAQCAIEGSLAPWTAWGANFLCYAIVPAGTIATLHAAVQRWLPHNYFVYFFVTVFAGSMLAFNFAGLARVALLSAAGTLAWGQLAGEYFVYLPMMSLAEAFMNGIVMAVAVVFRPEWVATFDDRLYLTRR
jgi:uncharacterized membrane protein